MSVADGNMPDHVLEMTEAFIFPAIMSVLQCGYGVISIMSK